MQVILGDYVGAILGLARDGSNWRLNPLMELRRLTHEFAPRGEGNVVSIEFNLLYRWHATLSKQDKEWTENMFQKALDGAGVNVSFDKLTPRQFFQAAGKALGPQQEQDVRTWTFNNLKRDSSGRFSDADIAKLLQDSTSYRAGAFKARAIPEVLKVIEILGITQARGWGACSLNEFRKFIGLEPYSSFKDWNNDDSVANSAELLYKHIDNLELHVGLQAEQPKRPGPGAGLCPGYTISRAILADAVCLTRGDRFLTVDFTPFNLTTWGYADCQYPTAADGSYGGMLTKLLFRHFPAYYPARSAYAHFPFLEPSYMEKTMRERDATNKTNIADQYIWSRPKPPVGVQSREISVVDSYVGASEILNSPQVWKSDYDERLGIVVAGLKHPALPDTTTVEKVLNAFSDTWPAFFRQTTDRLLTTRSVSRAGSSLKFVDIVKDVINVLPVQWICENLAGISIESSYVDNLNDVCQYVFLDWEPVDDWELRESSVGFFRKFHELVKRHLEKESHFISNTISHIRGPPHGKRTAFLETLHEKHGSMSADQLAAALFCLVVPTAAHWSQSVAHVVNYYLDHNRKGERSEIVSLVNAGKTHEAMGLIRAALDADPPVSAVQRTALKATVVPGMSAKEVVAGENVLVSIVEANQNIPTGKQGIIGVGEYG
jgi:linoleate 10R-lipoxygenase